MMRQGFCSGVLHVAVKLATQGLDVEYRVDSRAAATMRVRYPFTLTPGDIQTLPAMSLGLGTYLATMCLARRVVVTPAPSVEMVRDLMPIIEELYDVRRWMDELALDGPPEISAVDAPCSELSRAGRIPERATLLFSGGKDSTLAALVLDANGFEVSPVHMSVNEGVRVQERNAARRITKELGRPLVEIAVMHPDFLQFSDAYAVHWNSYPRSNRVPFGRDLLTSLLALPFARHSRSAVLSMGHDNECRNATVTYRGAVIARNDVEASALALVLERYINRHLLTIDFVPPVAGLSELMILRTMLLDHPRLMAQTASCFWGNNCGHCSKCLRYYLADRVFGSEVLRFRRNPLELGVCPELDDLLDPTGARSTLFQTAVLWCLGTLAVRQDVRSEETALVRFAQTRMEQVRHYLPAWQMELFATRTDPQVPATFRCDAADRSDAFYANAH